MMPHTDLAGSLIVARRICERVARATLQHDDEVLSPTISVGVAAGEPGRAGLRRRVRRKRPLADQFLERAVLADRIEV